MIKNRYIFGCLIGLTVFGCSDAIHKVPCSGDGCMSCVLECKNDHILRYCAPDGYQAEMYCPGGCQHNICYPGDEICEDGDTSCMGDGLVVCENGKWLYAECEFGCRNDRCNAECSNETDPYCVTKSRLRFCSDEQWTDTICEIGCENGRCVPECSDETPFCKSPYERRECVDHYWHDTVCEEGCLEGVCQPECSNEAPFCKGDFVLRECVDQYWSDRRCENGCADGACLPECSDETPFCRNPYEVRECVNQYWQDTACEYGCKDGACKNECSPDTVPFCHGPHDLRSCVDQKWSDRYCENGCEDGACLPECSDAEDGTPVCRDPMTIRQCVNSFWEYTNCENGCLNGECLDECTPIAPFCLDPDTVRKCVDTKWKDSTCEFGCREGECLECADGELKCHDGMTLKKCTYGEWTLKPCEFGCVEGECLPYPPECHGTSRSCISKDTLLICEDEIWELVLCESEMCADGECLERLPVCNEGDSECLDIKTRQYCENNEIQMETCDYVCDEGQCIPEPEPECFSSTSMCLDEKTLRMCLDGFWADMVCEYQCENGICVSEDKDYECLSNVGACKDDKNELKCVGNGWASYECPEQVCLGGSCVNKIQTCYVGQTECRNRTTILECVNGYYNEVKCPPGYVCMDMDCRDANGVFEDPRAYNPICTGDQAYLDAVCDSLFTGAGTCVETNNDHTFYCVGACDPDNPTPYQCEDSYPFEYAISGECRTISDGTYALVPHDRYLCENKCDPETGCDNEIYNAHIRDVCDDIPNTCNGDEISYCFGRKISYNCFENFGPGYTCAIDKGDVLCAERCTKEGETLDRCINMPTGKGLVPTNYKRVCKRFDDGNLYYRDIYGEECPGGCHTAGTRCIDKSNRPQCDTPLSLCDSMYPDLCQSDEICVIESGQPRCGWRVEPGTQETAFCATNGVTNVTYYEETHICPLVDGTYAGLRYLETCEGSACNSRGGGCNFVK